MSWLREAYPRGTLAGQLVYGCSLFGISLSLSGILLGTVNFLLPFSWRLAVVVGVGFAALLAVAAAARRRLKRPDQSLWWTTGQAGKWLAVSFFAAGLVLAGAALALLEKDWAVVLLWAGLSTTLSIIMAAAVLALHYNALSERNYRFGLKASKKLQLSYHEDPTVLTFRGTTPEEDLRLHAHELLYLRQEDRATQVYYFRKQSFRRKDISKPPTKLIRGKATSYLQRINSTDHVNIRNINHVYGEGAGFYVMPNFVKNELMVDPERSKEFRSGVKWFLRKFSQW